MRYGGSLRFLLDVGDFLGAVDTWRQQRRDEQGEAALSQALTQSARAYAECMEDPRIAPLLANVDKHDVMGQSDGAGAEHLAFLLRNYAPEYFAFDVVDSLRRIVLSGGLVFIPERGRAAGGTMIAFFFYGSVSYTHLTLPTNREV